MSDKDLKNEDIVEPTEALEEVETPEEENLEEVSNVSEPVITETLTCEACQGDGKWDGVVCEVCKGSGKIFKDGTVISTADGSFVFKGGKALKQ